MLKLALPVALVLAGAALAQDAATNEAPAEGAMDHGAMDHHAAMAHEGHMAAMDAMMQAMEGMETTGQPDADFLLMMIPHHQAAIDMARVQLEHGEIGPVRDMAQRVIDAQEAEIEEMRQMLVEMNHANLLP